jgi:hypothetical protein
MIRSISSTPVKLKWQPGNKDWGATSGQTKLLVAGVAQWVRFVGNRWQEKSHVCAWPITYEARENLLSSCRCNISTRADDVIVIQSVWKLCCIILLWWFISVMMMMMISLHGVGCVKKYLTVKTWSLLIISSAKVHDYYFASMYCQ